MLQAMDVRVALEEMLSSSIQPIARRYRYSLDALTRRASWKPIVLLIGNYSSGKSTLINEFLGSTIQRTGQSPTDDCFTILTSHDQDGSMAGSDFVDEIPGTTIVNDASLPFGSFKEFGTRFLSHLLMKRVGSPKLDNLVIIDSPGMLDSVTEFDRGYDYQEVIGRFAELADLVVLCFDPHRAGTVQETYVSIRATLPQATSEDRVVFVLNRIDECASLIDLVRSYGVLCWNLSQMTGRKDIPRIYLTFSPILAKRNEFAELADERRELIDKIEQAPRLQINHLLGVYDNHLHRLELIAGTLANATAKFTRALAGYLGWGCVGALAAGVLIDTLIALFFGVASDGLVGRILTGRWTFVSLIIPATASAVCVLGLLHFYRRSWYPRSRQNLLDTLDDVANLNTQYAKDLWEKVRGPVADLLADARNFSPLAPHRSNANKLRRLIDTDLRRLYEQHLGRPTSSGR